MIKPEYSVMYCGDLHGDIYSLEQAIEKFEESKVDKLCFIGDYLDGPHTDTENIHLLKEVIRYKIQNPTKVILLLGNHDLHYAYNPDYKCSGFRQSIALELQDLFNLSRDKFQVAWKNGDYMATHAGILRKWLVKYNDRLSYYENKFNIDRVENIDILLNAINDTHDRWILHTVGLTRGGHTGSVGGITWADMGEIIDQEGCTQKHCHIIGHNKVNEITKLKTKGGANVVFIDCLHKQTNFLTITKPDE